MNRIKQYSLPLNADFYERIILLEAKMGHIEYTLIDPDENKYLKELLSLRIVIVSH